MRIYLQKPEETDSAPRFYHILIKKDLLEGWTLVKESGFQGSSGRVKKQHFSNRDEAEHALLTLRDSQIERGFK